MSYFEVGEKDTDTGSGGRVGGDVTPRPRGRYSLDVPCHRQDPPVRYRRSIGVLSG